VCRRRVRRVGVGGWRALLRLLRGVVLCLRVRAPNNQRPQPALTPAERTSSGPKRRLASHASESPRGAGNTAASMAELTSLSSTIAIISPLEQLPKDSLVKNTATMIQLKSMLNVIDNSGAAVAECINVLKMKRAAKVGKSSTFTVPKNNPSK
jgi:hypothetical protein